MGGVFGEITNRNMKCSGHMTKPEGIWGNNEKLGERLEVPPLFI